MADKSDDRVDVLDADDEELPEQTDDRDEELVNREKMRDRALELFADVEKGFQDSWERANDQLDYWDIYNCELGANQFYSGNSKIFLPIVSDAVEARRTRFTNQIFPQSGRNVEVRASEEKPQALVSLLEHYIRKARLRTRVVPSLLLNGDIEGQYNCYVGWARNKRHVAMRVKRGMTVDQEFGLESADDEHDDIEEQTITHEHPIVEVLSDMDVLILPMTATGVEHAIQDGGSVTILRRWSKAKIRRLIREREIDKDAGQAMLKEMGKVRQGQDPDKRKAMLGAAGLHGGKGGTAQVFETWTMLKIKDELRLCRIFFGGEDNILSIKRCPYWCDKVPLLSAPLTPIDGSAKGVSKIKKVQTLQYQANDAVNEGMDSAAYALMPIIMTDPEKNPRVGSMVLSVAAIWETDPQSTQFAKFPELWKDAFTIVSSCKDQIFQTLSVNPSMMPQQVMAQGKKPNQAQIANEQMVDILTTADAVTNVEGEILTPMLQWFVWLDHQYRDTDMTIESFGELGIQAEMERIEPIQMDRRFEFRWFGVEAARNQQQIQMQMAGLNVLRGLQPQYYPGYEINLVPIISQFVENTFGPRLATQIFQDVRKKLTLEPQFENTLLEAGFEVPVHPMDEDAQHLQEHQQAFQEHGDYHGTLRQHMIMHSMQMQKKQQAMLAQQSQMLQGAQGSPGGSAPGVAGTPRQGARPGQSRNQGPPGMIPQDQMRGGPPRMRGTGR